MGLDAVAAITLTQKVFISAILKKRNGAQTRYRSSPAEGSAGEMAHVTLKIVLYAATDDDLEGMQCESSQGSTVSRWRQTVAGRLQRYGTALLRSPHVRAQRLRQVDAVLNRRQLRARDPTHVARPITLSRCVPAASP